MKSNKMSRRDQKGWIMCREKTYKREKYCDILFLETKVEISYKPRLTFPISKLLIIQKDQDADPGLFVHFCKCGLYSNQNSKLQIINYALF